MWLSPADPPGRPAGEIPGPLALADELGGPGGPAGTAVEVVYGSSSLPGGELLTLVSVMDTLRRNCPWDARQTHESLAPYLLEESYEALDALESGDRAALREELGDVLLQVMFHARVAAERSDGTGFTVDDVADGIVTKLVRRHPHVFGSVTVSGADDVTRNWDTIKAAERAERATGDEAGSALDGVPFSQPALALAAQLQRRAERAGIPPDLVVPGGPDGGSRLGAELFELVAQARRAGLDPELELRAAARRYADQVRRWERGQAEQDCAAGNAEPGQPQSDQADQRDGDRPGPAWPVPTPAVTPLGSITDKSAELQESSWPRSRRCMPGRFWIPAETPPWKSRLPSTTARWAAPRPRAAR